MSLTILSKKKTNFSTLRQRYIFQKYIEHHTPEFVLSHVQNGENIYTFCSKCNGCNISEECNKGRYDNRLNESTMNYIRIKYPEYFL